MYAEEKRRKISVQLDQSEITFLYFAPEMFNGTLPNFHTDMWAVGVVVLEVLMGKYFWGKTRKR